MSEEEGHRDPRADWASIYKRLRKPHADTDQSYVLHFVKRLRESAQASLPNTHLLDYTVFTDNPDTAEAWIRFADLFTVQVKTQPDATIASIKAAAIAATGIPGTVTVEPGTGSDISPAETHSINYQHAALIFLAITWWLILFAIPALVITEKLPPDIQSMADVYDGLIAVFAYPITVAILAKHKRK